jgi:hypothetical protein
MKAINFLPIILTSMLLLFSCNKEAMEPHESEPAYQSISDGTYVGTFSVQYSLLTKTAPVTIVIDKGKYSCTGNSDRIPAGGSGAFSNDNKTITFVDVNFWTCEFDWNLILSGTYIYISDGNKLLISITRNNFITYTYTLEKNVQQTNQ